MSISKIDDNLSSRNVQESDITWLNSRESIFSVHGVFYNEREKLYMRIPKDVALSIKEGIFNLSCMCSGGRIRFLTDSPYVAIKGALPAFKPAPHMSITASHGFSLYVNGKFAHRYSPTFDNFTSGADFSTPLKSRIYFAESKELFGSDGSLKLCEIYMPLYGGVSELYIGVKSGAKVLTAPDYKIKKPIVFYGSSITQGACVSRPGNDYVSILARRLNCDYINLGFSGNGNAEAQIIDYMTTIDASLYAYDYNLYDDRPKRILPPHYSIYERIRKARPNVPILLYDKPFYEYDTTYERRRDLIRSTYDLGCADKDNLLGVVETTELFGSNERDCCAADPSHPNDLGAMRMADAMYPIVKELIIKSGY